MKDNTFNGSSCNSLTLSNGHLRLLFLVVVFLFCYQMSRLIHGHQQDPRSYGRKASYIAPLYIEQEGDINQEIQNRDKQHDGLESRENGEKSQPNGPTTALDSLKLKFSSMFLRNEKGGLDQVDEDSTKENMMGQHALSETNRPTNDASTNQNKLEKRLPQCLIIGFTKCGSYALASFLQLHPDLLIPSSKVEYFRDPKYSKGPEWYRDQMPPSLPHQVTMEKTSSYIMHGSSMQRIHQFNSSIKLIVMVRDPVTRVQSLYAQKKYTNPNFTSAFEEFVEETILSQPTESLSYIPKLKFAYKLFPPEQLLVLSEENLEKNPVKVMQEIETFLGLKRVFTDDVLVFNENKGFFCVNVSHPVYKNAKYKPNVDPENGCFFGNKGRKHESYRPDLFRATVQSAQSYNQQLFDLIGKRFEWTGSGDL